MRIVNRSARAGTVRIDAVDDVGDRFGPASLALGSRATVHFNSSDLEAGNASKGLSTGVGDGQGDWRLVLTTALDIEALAYIRTPDGFLTSMHDVVQPEVDIRFSPTEFDDAVRYRVPFFNPASNTSKVSRLRLVNPSSTGLVVTIRGRDAAGAPPPGGEVRLTLAADASRTVTAQALERGAPGLQGRFGNGAGKWSLWVSAEDASSALPLSRPLQIVNLLHSRGSGNLANLSSAGPGNDPGRGTDGPDFITGGGGDDVLNPGDNDGSGDRVFGSAGDDTIVYSDSGPSAWQALDYSGVDAGISATIDGLRNRATVDKGSAGADAIVDVARPLAANAFHMAGSPSDDTFRLTLGAGQWMGVRGNAGNDRFDIRSGSVQIDYRSSTRGIDADLAAGRVNDDGFGSVDTIVGDVWKLIGGVGNDTIRGTGFSDTLLGSDRDDRFIGRGGNDVIDGRCGYDLVRFDSRGAGAVRVDLHAGTATGTWDGAAFSCRLSGIEHVRGSHSSAGDDLLGSNGDDRLEGRGGDDTINGRRGDDRLYGGDGDDVFVFDRGHGHDRIYDFADGDLIILIGLGVASKQDVLDHAWAWEDGTGVHIDLTRFGGGKIDLPQFPRDVFDASDFLL